MALEVKIKVGQCLVIKSLVRAPARGAIFSGLDPKVVK